MQSELAVPQAVQALTCHSLDWTIHAPHTPTPQFLKSAFPLHRPRLFLALPPMPIAMLLHQCKLLAPSHCLPAWTVRYGVRQPVRDVRLRGGRKSLGCQRWCSSTTPWCRWRTCRQQQTSPPAPLVSVPCCSERRRHSCKGKLSLCDDWTQDRQAIQTVHPMYVGWIRS